MTITRLWQAGGELNFLEELSVDPSAPTASEMSVSSTKARTGTYSFRMQGTAKARGRAFTSTTQIRAGFYLNFSGSISSAGSQRLYLFTARGTYNIVVELREDIAQLDLLVNGSVVDSCTRTESGLVNPDVWYHLALTCKANATTGFVTFYVDGVPVLTWTGNTGSAITGLYAGGTNSSASWSNSYIDDFYIDDATGEPDDPPPSPRFLFGLVNAAGAAANLTPNTGANYAAVDETTSDGDTTYVYAAAAAVKDSYNTANVTVPVAHFVRAVIPIAVVRKTDSGIDSRWKLGVRASGGTESLGSAQALGTGYAVIWERQTTEPGAGDWDETKANAAQIVIESAGSF